MDRNRNQRYQPYTKNNFSARDNDYRDRYASCPWNPWLVQQPPFQDLNTLIQENSYFNNLINSESFIARNENLIRACLPSSSTGNRYDMNPSGNNTPSVSSLLTPSDNINNGQPASCNIGKNDNESENLTNSFESVPPEKKMIIQDVPAKKVINLCTNMSLNQLMCEDNSWVQEIMNNFPGFEERMRLFILAIAEGNKFYKNGEDLCKTIEKILKPVFKGLKFTLKLFGSSVTNLALKGSGYDVFMEFADQKLPMDSAEIITRALKRNKKMLKFKKFTALKSELPVVNCERTNGPSCNISFSNKPLSAIYNSALVKFFVSLDERVRPLILMLKFWMMKNNFLDASKIPSYGLSLLVIFYLQQLSEPILPSVHQLQLNCKPLMIDGRWNVAFNADPTLLPSTSNKSSIVDLIKGFFNFCKNFDFDTKMISVYLGKALPKSGISPDSLPDEYELYKNYFNDNSNEKFSFEVNFFKIETCDFDEKDPMWLQDPFDHNLNVARNLKSLVRFKRRISWACDIINGEIEGGDYFLKIQKLFTGEKKRGRQRQRRRRRGKKRYYKSQTVSEEVKEEKTEQTEEL